VASAPAIMIARMVGLLEAAHPAINAVALRWFLVSKARSV